MPLFRPNQNQPPYQPQQARDWPTLTVGGTSVTVTPAQLTVTTSVLAPTVTAIRNATVSPSQQTITVSAPDATVSATRNATATPDQQTVALTVLDPTVSTNGSVDVTVQPEQLVIGTEVLDPTVIITPPVTVFPSVSGPGPRPRPDVLVGVGHIVGPIGQVRGLGRVQRPQVEDDAEALLLLGWDVDEVLEALGLDRLPAEGGDFKQAARTGLFQTTPVGPAGPIRIEIEEDE